MEPQRHDKSRLVVAEFDLRVMQVGDRGSEAEPQTAPGSRSALLQPIEPPEPALSASLLKSAILKRWETAARHARAAPGESLSVEEQKRLEEVEEAVANLHRGAEEPA